MEALITSLPEVTNQNIYLYAFVGGFVPPLIWLWFWLREDSKNPEPTRVILGAFLFGALSALFALPFQGLFAKLFPAATITVSIIVFAFVEEIMKLFSVELTSLRDPANDEAFDPIIYMLTAALGFAALENTLYLIDYLNNFDLLNSLLERSKRFFGATLLHVLSSVLVGISLSLSYGSRKKWRPLFLPIGLGAAVTLHAMFNIFVTKTEPGSVINGFIIVWVVFLLILAALEFLKSYLRKARRERKEALGITFGENPFGK